jgi:peptide/nickel transport system ATP-binding protein
MEVIAPDTLLQVENLKTYFYDSMHRGFFRIVDDMSFRVPSGKTVAIVGESGSGKTRMVYSIMGLNDVKPGVIGGHIYLRTDGQVIDLLEGLEQVCSITEKNDQLTIRKDERRWRKQFGYEEKMKGIRGRRIGLMMQEAKSALSPYQKVLSQMREAYIIGQGTEEGVDEGCEFLLRELQILDKASEYPHNLSGGTCHRAMMALSFAADPDLLIADEPTTGLDCPLQVKVVEMLDRYRRGELMPRKVEKPRSLLLVSHQLEIVEKLADEIIVMYGGQMMEMGNAEAILNGGAQHPYTRQIVDIYRNPPNLENLGEDGLSIIPGSVPSPLSPSAGCRFSARCTEVKDACYWNLPVRKPREGNGGYVWCQSDGGDG